MKLHSPVKIEVKTYLVSRPNQQLVVPAFVECQHDDKIYKHNYRSNKTAYCKAKRILYMPEFKLEQNFK